MKSLREPQLTPSEHCYTILQDHGPNQGGWGPAAISFPGVIDQPQPFVYTGSDENVLSVLQQMVRQMANASGKPTMFVKYTQREDLFSVGGSS